MVFWAIGGWFFWVFLVSRVFCFAKASAMKKEMGDYIYIITAIHNCNFILLLLFQITIIKESFLIVIKNQKFCLNYYF
jgi:hypothetical protein